VLRCVEGGSTLEEAARKAGVHVNTILLWKKKYGQLGTAEIREMNNRSSVPEPGVWALPRTTGSA
jgi:transposase